MGLYSAAEKHFHRQWTLPKSLLKELKERKLLNHNLFYIVGLEETFNQKRKLYIDEILPSSFTPLNKMTIKKNVRVTPFFIILSEVKNLLRLKNLERSFALRRMNLNGLSLRRTQILWYSKSKE